MMAFIKMKIASMIKTIETATSTWIIIFDMAELQKDK